jgi:hypothetical protein
VLASVVASGLLATTAASASNLLTNGDFSAGVTGWTVTCATWGGVPNGRSDCYTVGAGGLALSTVVGGESVYAFAGQEAASGPNAVLSGSVDVAALDHANQDGVRVIVELLDSAHALVATVTLSNSWNFGARVDTTDATHRDIAMASWEPGAGPQSFSVDLAAALEGLSGVDPGAVSYVRVTPWTYDGAAATFGNLSLAPSATCPIEVPSTPPNSANTCVTADVVSTITVTAPALVSFGSLAVGETAGPVAAPVNVKSNAGGYQLSVTRTVFTNGDLPLSVASAAPADPAQVLDLSGLTAIPTSGSVDIGHRSGSITPDAGDTWPLSLTLGPVPATATGTHASIVTFTAVGF